MVRKILERIKCYAFYGDTDKESYNSIKNKIEDVNRKTALVFATVAMILISIMLLLSNSQEGFSSSRVVYICGICLSAVQVAIAHLGRKFRWLSYVSVYAAISVFFGYGIAIGTLSRPEEQTVTFMVMIIFVPLIFLDRPIRMAFVIILFIVIFIVLAYYTKTDPVLSVDVTDAVIFGLLAIVAESVVYRAKIRGYVLENKLHIMSETDQLTGLNNRNCYEWRLNSYPPSCKRSICCIYMDANGLHDLNNNKGHKAGDEMLCYIADIVRKLFGSRDTYRIGGDEFVAFTVDMPLEEVETKIADMREQITGKGYHSAVGYEFCGSGDINMSDLIVKAESNMFKDKSEYYKQHDRRARR